MTDLVVAKFGGTSVADFDAMNRSIDVALLDANTRIVVLSASAGVTNILVALAGGLEPTERFSQLDALRQIQFNILERLRYPNVIREEIERLLENITTLAEAAALASSTALTDELVSHGELMSTLLFVEILRERGIQAQWFDARKVLRTNDRFGRAEPDIAAVAELTQQQLAPRLAVIIGVSLKQEGISYIAGAELPCLIVNVMRGGPGLGTIQPSQADYFQTVKGGGHGDYRLIALAPASVQEMADFVGIAFDLAFKYRNPAIILADGVIGQMMEKVVLPEQRTRLTDEEVIARCPWATTGRTHHRTPNIITSLELDPAEMEKRNIHLQKKYAEIEENEVRFEELHCEDAEYLIVAFGSCARIAQKAMEIAREEGIKVGLLRPITLWPFPSKAIAARAAQVKGILTVELNAGQMVEDVRLAVECKVPVEHFGRLGGIVPDPDEVITALKEKLIK